MALQLMGRIHKMSIKRQVEIFKHYKQSKSIVKTSAHFGLKGGELRDMIANKLRDSGQMQVEDMEFN